jgi:hypothetical protein
MLNDEAMQAHVDALFGSCKALRAELGDLGFQPRAVARPVPGCPDLDALAVRDALHADRLTLSLGALVPIYGTLRIDRRVFGGVRPSAVVFDWIIGGLAPATLGVIALVDRDHRDALAWTALGLYAGTRIGILVIGNLHVSAFNRAVDVRLGLGGVAATF